MFNSILVPIDLADTDLAKPAIATAATLSQTWKGTVRLLNILPMTPVMLSWPRAPGLSSRLSRHPACMQNRR
jgi:hypothetical protein